MVAWLIASYSCLDYCSYSYVCIVIVVSYLAQKLASTLIQKEWDQNLFALARLAKFFFMEK